MVTERDKKYVVFGTLFSVLFLYLAFRGVSFLELNRAVIQANWWYVAPFLITAGLFFWLKAERWSLLLTPTRKIASKYLVASMMIGVAINYIFFAYVGELARTYFLARQTGLRKASILGSVILERLFDFLTLLILLGIGFSLSEKQVPVMGEVSIALWIIMALLIVTIVLMVFKTEPSFRVLKKMLSLLPEHFAQTVVHQTELGIQGFRSICHPKLLIGSIITSFAMWLLMAFCNYLAVLSLGIDVPFYAMFYTMALIVLGVTLPNSPGHIGVIELCYVLSLQAYGVPATEAFAAGLIFHVVLYAAVILFGVSVIKSLGMTVHEVKDKAEEIEEQI